MAFDWTVLKLLEWTTAYFQSHDIDSPRSTAEILLAAVLDLERIDLYLRYDQPLQSTELQRFKTLIRRRVSREPVAYIVGRREFWSLDLMVSPDVLIPRPETECLVEQALPLLDRDRPLRVLDLGTGSGAIAIALAHEVPQHRYWASDVSEPAVRVARRNAIQHGLQDRVVFFCSAWMDALHPRRACFDLIISNPPYIPGGQIDRLQPEIAQFEPRGALDGGAGGIDCIRAILREAPRYLTATGTLLMEIGEDQRVHVERLAGEIGGYQPPVFFNDYAGAVRGVHLGRARPKSPAKSCDTNGNGPGAPKKGLPAVEQFGKDRRFC